MAAVSAAGERICHGLFAAPATETTERRVRIVVAVTFAMMLGELAVGLTSGSLALVAEAWHMGSHAGAIGLTAVAYWFARTRANHAGFAFGTGKVHALAGFTNGIILVAITILTIAEACARFFEPVKVDLREALPVAAVGLVVNAACALLLQHDHHLDDEREAHADHNLRAAYLHVLGDVVVSLGAMVALVGIRVSGWTVLDPLMAMVSSVVILKWGVGLCRTTSRQLLDVSGSTEQLADIRERLEAEGARVVDLHLWQVAPGHTACVVSVVAPARRPLAELRAAILEVAPVDHLTVEIDGDRA